MPKGLCWKIRLFGKGHNSVDSLGILPEKDVHCLLKAALPKRTILIAIDAVPGDGHEVAAAGHAVDERRQVPIVYVGSIELDDVSNLLHERLAGRFDAEHVQDVDQMIAGRPSVIDVGLAHYLRTERCGQADRQSSRAALNNQAILLLHKAALFHLAKGQKARVKSRP